MALIKAPLFRGLTVYYNIDNVKCVHWNQDNKEEWSDVPCNAKDNVFVCEKDGKANMTLTTYMSLHYYLTDPQELSNAASPFTSQLSLPLPKSVYSVGKMAVFSGV